MARGRTADGLWRGRELIEDWLARQQAPLCACGCSTPITLKRAHRHAGIPSFVWGHHSRVGRGHYKGVDRWVAANQGQHRCACGCGRVIVIRPKHHATGIPRYWPNHGPRPKLGVGAEHPRFIKDREQVVRPRVFPVWVKRVVVTAFRGRCAWCGTSDAIEVDHIKPASLGGEPTLENAQLLCANCHRWKSAIEPTSRAGKTPASRSRKHRKD